MMPDTSEGLERALDESMEDLQRVQREAAAAIEAATRRHRSLWHALIRRWIDEGADVIMLRHHASVHFIPDVGEPTGIFADLLDDLEDAVEGRPFTPYRNVNHA